LPKDRRTVGAGLVPVVTRRYCAARYPPPRRLARGIDPGRARLLRETELKWLNGDTIHYWFFDKPARWTADEAQKDVVRRAFRAWKALGLGLSFVEVPERRQADARIAFDQTDGSWSYIGTDVRTRRQDPRTMNFGWDLTTDPDTALHEIGHTLGFPHEHQNPFSGIVWNEPAVYAALAKPPNSWPRSVTYHNIIEKLAADAVQGSSWDPDSIMHYPFEPGLILEPERYRNGLVPAGGLSQRDRSWALRFYAAQEAAALRALTPLQSATLSLAPGQQANFLFTPGETRDYEFRTFGTSDTVMALYRGDGSGSSLAQDDDSGEDRNAYLKAALTAGQTYLLRVRLCCVGAQGEAAVMAW
jgi:hypothetical protein